MKIASALVALMALSSPAIAASRWVQIQPGNSFDYAKAVCDNASMGVGNGYVAFGSPSYVLGASIGNAIGNAILQARFFDNCMTMGGWKRVHVQPAPGRTVTNFSAGHGGEK